MDAANAYAYSILHDYAEAEEAAAISLIKAWEKLEQLREAENAGAWLFSIVRNTAIDRYRQIRSFRKRSATFEERTVADVSSDPFGCVIPGEYNKLAVMVLGDMNPLYSEILVMSLVECMSAAEVCSRLGINEKLRSVRLCRAKKEFRKKYSQMKETEDLFGEYMV